MNSPLIYYGSDGQGWTVGMVDPIISATIGTAGSESEAKQLAITIATQNGLPVYRRIKASQLRYEATYAKA